MRYVMTHEDRNKQYLVSTYYVFRSGTVFNPISISYISSTSSTPTCRDVECPCPGDKCQGMPRCPKCRINAQFLCPMPENINARHFRHVFGIFGIYSAFIRQIHIFYNKNCNFAQIFWKKCNLYYENMNLSNKCRVNAEIFFQKVPLNATLK